MSMEEQDLLHALRSYLMGSGRVLVIELDRDGRITDANVTFKSRFAGFGRVQGEPISRFFVHKSGEELDIEPVSGHRAPITHVVQDRSSGETYLLAAYAVGDGQVLLGELTDAAENDIVERMGHLAIELSRLVRDLRKANRDLEAANDLNQSLARSDPLTGIANRRYFMERLKLSIAHTQARQRRLSMLMIDLDHFKDINDRFGHAGGDSALLSIAALLASQVRAADLPCRFGGEEFAIYMTDAALDAAVDVAERIRDKISRLRPLDETSVITASIGVTELASGEDADALLKRADLLLYRAKTLGRNTVVAGATAADARARPEMAETRG